MWLSLAWWRTVPLLPWATRTLPLSTGPRLLGSGWCWALLLCSCSRWALLGQAPLTALPWMLPWLTTSRWRALGLLGLLLLPWEAPRCCLGQDSPCRPLLLRGGTLLPLLLSSATGARPSLRLGGLWSRGWPLLARLLDSRPRLALPCRTLLSLWWGLLGGGAGQTLTHCGTTGLWGKA